MKGYVLILLLMAALLLLIPLPALPRDVAANTDSVPTVTQPTTDSSVPDHTPVSEDVFRILVEDTVVELDAREFLIRTLAYEMAPTYHEEALKAQAVAAYTYHSRRRQQQEQQADPALQGAHFVSPEPTFPGNYTATALQAKWGDAYDANYNKLCRAVDAVLGQTITHDGTLIDACYFAVSWGSTESAATVWGSDIPYLQAVASPGDTLSPACTSTATFTAEELKSKIAAAHGDIPFTDDPAAWLGEPALSAAGSVTSLPVCGKELTGSRLRTALGLRSACFTVAYADGSFTFTVKGYGHGVGMSQYGADYLARQGYTYAEILRYYYTDVEVVIK